MNINNSMNRVNPNTLKSMSSSPEKDDTIALFELNNRTEITSRMAAEYSRMKYGSTIATRSIAKRIVKALKKDTLVKSWIQEKDLVLTASPYGYLPTAAATIVDFVAEILREEGVKVDILKIERTGAMGETHYCGMTKEQREESMRQRKTWISLEYQRLVVGRNVLGIDDISATGKHLADMRSVLAKTEAKSVMFAVYVKFSNDMSEVDAGAEGYISRFRVKSTRNLIPFLSKKCGLRLNARTLKFILQVSPSSDDDLSEYRKRRHLKDFLAVCNEKLLKEISAAIYSSDGYTEFDKFAEGIRLVEEEISSRRVKVRSRQSAETVFQLR